MYVDIERHRRDLAELARLGEEMLVDLSLRAGTGAGAGDAERSNVVQNVHGRFEQNYQRWYTEAAAVVGQLIPGRATEFERLYQGDGGDKSTNPAAYAIQDWLVGRRAAVLRSGLSAFDDLVTVSMRLKTQLDILRSAAMRFESSLFDIRQLVEANLFGSELAACRELSARGFLRAAGTIAGVLLERHLRRVAEAHGITAERDEPTIGDFNDQLKKAGVLDVPGWRQIQRFADIRNLCVHSKHREPYRKEVEELIAGVDQLLRTLA